MTEICVDAPSVWATSYGLYNQGRLIGKWFDLTDYTDKAEFLEAVAEFLKPHDTEPEVMFCDHQNIPKAMISESYVDPDLWEWLELSDDDKELLAVYQEHVCGEHYPTTIEQAKEAFVGKYADKGDWAEETLEEAGTLSEVPSALRNYIDFESYASDAEANGMSFISHGGEYWVFNG